MDEISHQDLAQDELNTVLAAVVQGVTLGNHGVEPDNAIELGQDNAIAKRGRGRPPTQTTADKDNAIAERGRGRPPKNNSERTGRPPTNADKVYSEYYKILEKSDYLTGETVRDKWLGKLLQGIEYVCDSMDCGKDEHKEKCGSVSLEKFFVTICITTSPACIFKGLALLLVLVDG
ncbi:hypothetical protein MKW98_019037 [Papaver atlanticum]|uniref:Uncharacterized protein n=1 Tax=Papaver atlanticum TaxID=357466 RepID=A0AAD4TJM7_9MAGN|nr:hypothetical protein MKW98_019037 [Papaver atlanticum]